MQRVRPSLSRSFHIHFFCQQRYMRDMNSVISYSYILCVITLSISYIYMYVILSLYPGVYISAAH